jgi:hypothetical protein
MVGSQPVTTRSIIDWNGPFLKGRHSSWVKSWTAAGALPTTDAGSRTWGVVRQIGERWARFVPAKKRGAARVVSWIGNASTSARRPITRSLELPFPG